MKRYGLSVLLLVAACGDPLPDQLETDIPEATPLSAVTAEQAQMFCTTVGMHTERFLESHHDGTCQFQGAVAAGVASWTNSERPLTHCLEAVEECRTTFSTGPRECDIYGATCDVTVGELQTCYDLSLELLGAFLDRFEPLSCQAIIDYSGEPFMLMEDPACEAIEARCPDLEWGLPTDPPVER